MRLLSCALTCGMSRDAAMMSYPGEIIDMYFWRREYDMMLHQVKFEQKGGDE